MTLFILERIKPGLRGELSRWLLEVHTGVFVGTLNARVRELLWGRVQESLEAKKGSGERMPGAWMINSAPNEQGYTLRFAGATDRELVDFDGLQLVARKVSGGPG